jgi:hypothetical protein
MGGFLSASIRAAFFCISSSCRSRRSSRSIICWCSCSLDMRVVLRDDARVGRSAGDGSQDARSDFFFGRGAGAGAGVDVSDAVAVVMRTFFLNLAGMPSCAFRFRWAARRSRAWRSSSRSPSSSSAAALLSSSSSDEESIWTSEASSPASEKPWSLSDSAKSSSRSESGSSLASIDFMRLPAVVRRDREVASHSTGSGSGSCSCFDDDAGSLSLSLSELSRSLRGGGADSCDSSLSDSLDSESTADIFILLLVVFPATAGEARGNKYLLLGSTEERSTMEATLEPRFVRG